MAGLILSFVVLLLLIALFVWLVTRALRSRRAYIKWPGVILSGLLALLFTIIFVVALIGTYRLNVAPYTYSVPNVTVNATQEIVARGQQKAILCAGCHAATAGSLPLEGSKDNFLAGTPFGVIYAPNLTPSGVLKDWTDGEIVRAIREGVDKNGRPLLIMPSEGFHGLSDADVQSLVAYIRSQPPSTHLTPARNLSIAASILVGAGVFPTSAQPPITAPVQSPPPGTADFGKYITLNYGCKDCHGPALTGLPPNSGPGPGAPSGPNLTLLVTKWSEDQFLAVFKTGQDPAGKAINPDLMPWKDYAKALTPAEFHDLYTYIHSLPPTQGPGK